MPSRHALLATVTAATLLGAAAAGGCATRPPRRAVTTSASRSEVTQPSPTTPSTSTPTRRPSSPAVAPPAPDPARTALARMTLAQRVGQLFMVGSPATSPSPATLAAVSRLHVGNVMLTGRSYAGTAAPARTARALRANATAAGVGMFVATDQEGGQVQVLQGPGIPAMPAALSQGGMAPARLQALAGGWGRQLRAAGVNLDLAPVLDVVPGAAAARTNPPVGALGREYGYTPATVASHGLAFAAGMRSVGVDVAVKHFPGLGRVHQNTDTSARVTDEVTTRHDPFLVPFAAAVRAGAPFVMISTATYTRVDPARPAAFSPTVIGGMLRHDLGFGGVVISDDLANARQVSAWTPGARAVGFLSAGGDMVLVVDAAPVAAMQRAVLARAGADATFRAKVDAAALRVLRAKAAAHLLP